MRVMASSMVLEAVKLDEVTSHWGGDIMLIMKTEV